MGYLRGKYIRTERIRVTGRHESGLRQARVVGEHRTAGLACVHGYHQCAKCRIGPWEFARGLPVDDEMHAAPQKPGLIPRPQNYEPVADGNCWAFVHDAPTRLTASEAGHALDAIEKKRGEKRAATTRFQGNTWEPVPDERLPSLPSGCRRGLPADAVTRSPPSITPISSRVNDDRADWNAAPPPRLPRHRRPEQEQDRLPPLPSGCRYDCERHLPGVIGEDGLLAYRGESGLWRTGGRDHATIYDALASALGVTQLDEEEWLLFWSARGWDGLCANATFHGHVLDALELTAKTTDGRMLEHEARVLAAEAQAQKEGG